MLDSIKVPCPHCNKWHHISVAYVQGQIKAMKIHKRDEVAQQMHDKCGPFYDKWLAAMEVLGPQLRCKDCKDYSPLSGDCFCVSEQSPHNHVTGGRFACKFIRPLEEPD